MATLSTEMLLAIRNIGLGSLSLTIFNSLIWAGAMVAIRLAIFDRSSMSFQPLPLNKNVSSRRFPLEVMLRYQRGVNSEW